MNNNIIYLISEDYIRQNSSIEFNFDVQFLYKSIEDTQKLYLEPTLGTKTYDYLLSLVDNGSISGDTIYKSLLTDYIQPMVLNYSLFNAVPLIHFKMNNKSINKLNSTNSETSDLDEIRYLQEYYKNIAEAYRERIKLHLIAHQNNYIYLYTESNVDEILPTDEDYDCAIVLD